MEEREDREGGERKKRKRGTWGFGERNSPTLNKFEGPRKMNFFLPSGATYSGLAEVPLH